MPFAPTLQALSAEDRAARYIADTVAVWPHMDKWNRDRLVAGRRRMVALRLTGWELDLRVLEALGVGTSLLGDAWPDGDGEASSDQRAA